MSDVEHLKKASKVGRCGPAGMIEPCLPHNRLDDGPSIVGRDGAPSMPS
jgi:hypothetical protein